MAVLLSAYMHAAEATAPTAGAPPVSVGRIAADGISLPLPSVNSDPVRVRSHTRMLDVDFKALPQTPATAVRYRFKLEGVDSDWRDPIGVMRFAVRFNDAKGNTISGEEFDAHGESQGWTGSLENSSFTPRRESLEVPEGAARLQIWLSSAGPQQTMGVYALSELAVTLIPASPQQRQSRIPLIPETGSLSGQPIGTPTGWARHGTSLGIARILPRVGEPPLILMRDDRPDAFGGWLTSTEESPRLDGIARIIVEWKEAYSIGWGGNARHSYPYLPAGDYRMHVQALTLEGRALGEAATTRIRVVPPFYETRWFWTGATIAAALLAAGTVQFLTRRKMQRRLDALERERAVDHERSRIARDLHDNLGADLTHLALLTELAQAEAGDASQARKYFDQIFDLANTLTRQVDEMVWAVNPSNDSIKGFIPFLSNYFQTYLAAAEISCRLDIPSELADFRLSSAQRHHLFLVVKEALHNIVKHAKASEARMRIRTGDQRLEIRVEDDGCGIQSTVPTGNGTGNMLERVASIGAVLERTSEVGKGTAVVIILPLSNLP